MNLDGNRDKYESPEVVLYYETQTELQPCEAYIFKKYVKPGLAILDMGVGAGRTTSFLSNGAQRYVGADYSRAMIDSFGIRYPHLERHQCDATEMSQFLDSEFDVVVFSFNGIDVIDSDNARLRCLSETARILKPGGVFIFSSHNAKILAAWPKLSGARVHQILWRILLSLVKSVRFTFNAFSGVQFSNGEGYIRDPVHGGMDHYVSTPETMSLQLKSVGFEIMEYVGGHFPEVKSAYLTPWYYYACRKTVGV